MPKTLRLKATREMTFNGVHYGHAGDPEYLPEDLLETNPELEWPLRYAQNTGFVQEVAVEIVTPEQARAFPGRPVEPEVLAAAAAAFAQVPTKPGEENLPPASGQPPAGASSAGGDTPPPEEEEEDSDEGSPDDAPDTPKRRSRKKTEEAP